MSRLAVIILTKNEEANIEGAIASASFADEILVIDSGSSDRTQELAEQNGAKVISNPMDETGFAGQRNFALTQTEAEWVLYLDADERLNDELALEIQNHIAMNSTSAAEIMRLNVVMGQIMYHGVYRPDYCQRLFKRDDVYWESVVHEHAVTSAPLVRLKTPMKHLCLVNWNQYVSKLDRYTTLMAEEMKMRGKKTNIMNMHSHALFAFLKMYCLKGGFLDGKMGFILCQFHYFYTLMKYVKLYDLYKREKETA